MPTPRQHRHTLRSAFDEALAELYWQFAKYPASDRILARAIHQEEAESLGGAAIPLHLVDWVAMDAYALQAMTTVGGLNDLKHYLPLLLELLADGQLSTNTFIILGKLDYAEWETWPQQEQQAIRSFLRAWWAWEINTRSWFDLENLVEISRRLGDFPALLGDWDLDPEQQGYRNFVGMLQDDYPSIIEGIGPCILPKPDRRTLAQWVTSNAHRLEEGFFRFAETDRDFAEAISSALGIYEMMLPYAQKL
ncbi:MAG: hypothetical protein CSA97_04785 [Bacteroidetes bacterium]|nr:MAG: hypothetical protein CSA97_04785 [Bacteroidota bacterium]